MIRLLLRLRLKLCRLKVGRSMFVRLSSLVRLFVVSGAALVIGILGSFLQKKINQDHLAPTSKIHPPRVAYQTLTAREMGLSDAEARFVFTGPVAREVLGRRIPETVSRAELQTGDWFHKTVPLPEANTLDHWYYQERRFGVLEAVAGDRTIFVPQVVLLKLKDQPLVAALRVPQWQELEAIRWLQSDPRVAYAGLNRLHQRAAAPNDPLIESQWHHDVMNSFDVWASGWNESPIRVAIMDSPFQMNHGDLAAHVDPGWNAFANEPVTNSAGIDHSTGAAGLVAAVINNGTGVAGVVNCRILPIQINGTSAEMYVGTLWAATNNVRVVNISWTGADDPIMNFAGAALRDGCQGVLAMIGGNGATRREYPNQPLVIAVAGTDANDNAASASGPHIDFAAPGFPVFTTAVKSGYGAMAGTSFATPLFCGAAALVLSINPALGTAEVVELLKSTAEDLGAPGWDEVFGWGRIDLARAAAAARLTLGNTPPQIDAIPAQWVFAGQTLAIAVTAQDPDVPPQQLTYTLATNSPEGTTIDPSTGLFSWTPSSAQIGQPVTVNVAVTDNGEPPAEATTVFPVHVLASNYTFTASFATGGEFPRLTWPALTGLRYGIESKSNLSALDWTVIAEVIAPDESGFFSLSNRFGGDQGYFRIRMKP